MSPVNEIGTDTRRCGLGFRAWSAGSVRSMAGMRRLRRRFIGPRGALDTLRPETDRGPANGGPECRAYASVVLRA